MATIQKIVNLVRDSVLRLVDRTQPILHNEGIVEIDESLIAKRKYNLSHMIQQQWLFGVIERRCGQILIKTVLLGDLSIYGKIISDFIASGTTIY